MDIHRFADKVGARFDGDKKLIILQLFKYLEKLIAQTDTEENYNFLTLDVDISLFALLPIFCGCLNHLSGRRNYRPRPDTDYR